MKSHVSSKSQQEELGGISSHDSEANPLHPNLCDTQQRSSTFEGANLLAALDVAARLGQGEDVGELGVGAGNAEKDEVRRDAFGCTTGDNAVVLEEVREEDADND